MSMKNLPVAPMGRPSASLRSEILPRAMERWSPEVRAADRDEERSISIYDAIGYDPWTGEGVTAKRVAGALRSLGKGPVTVNINSPGGDMFEGLAIYNLLRAHPAAVTVEVLGLAASAASIIAMAGDEIHMSPGSFLMLHNAWGVVIGNRHDMAEAAALFESFDAALAGIYAARSGRPQVEIAALLDAETFLGAEEAITAGMADGMVEGSAAGPLARSPQSGAQSRPDIQARCRIDAALAQQGIPRSARRAMLRDLTGTRNAAEPATQNAGIPLSAIRQLIDTIRS